MRYKKKFWDKDKKTRPSVRNFTTHYGCPIASWHLSKKCKAVMTALIASQRLKVPNSWPPTSAYFSEDYEKIKIAESMAFCGDRGAYFLSLTDIQPAVRDEFIELLHIAGSFVNKTMTPAEQRELQRRLVQVLAKLETRLPLYWNTSTRHYLLHLCKFIASMGHFWVCVTFNWLLLFATTRYCIQLVIIISNCIHIDHTYICTYRRFQC